MNAPQVKCCPLITTSPPFSPPPPIRPISGSRNDVVNAATSAVNAVPMTTATARSTTLPRSRNSLKPLIMGSIQPHAPARACTAMQFRAAAGDGERVGGRGRGGAQDRVVGDQQQPGRRSSTASAPCAAARTRRSCCHDLGRGGVRRGRQHVHTVAGADQGGDREVGEATGAAT